TGAAAPTAASRAASVVRAAGGADAQAVGRPAPPLAGPPPEQPLWISLANNGTAGHTLTTRTIARICERRLGTSKVHALRHTFARTMEDAKAKVSEIQAALGHADLGTTGRYLAHLQQGEIPHLAAVSLRYGLGGFERRRATTGASPENGETGETGKTGKTGKTGDDGPSPGDPTAANQAGPRDPLDGTAPFDA